MIIVFRGDPNELASGRGLSRQSITIEGVTFVMNEPRDASMLSERAKRKLGNNPHWEVVADFDGEVREVGSPAIDAEEAAEAAAHVERAAARRGKK